MIKLFLFASVVLVASCTVNVYDYSTHSGSSSQEPDTVYVEPSPPAPPAEPDTTISRRALAGSGGVVIIENCGSWTRYTLKGCFIETDGVALEMSPVLIRTEADDGVESSTFQMVFILRLQDYMFGSDSGDIFSGSSGSGSVLPVVTGTRLLALVVDRTTFPFLVEEANAFESDWSPGGTISCTAVFPIAEWEMRIICMADQIVAVSDDPEYRLLYGDTERRLLQQFYDIFVIHNGEAPVLPVQAGREDSIR